MKKCVFAGTFDPPTTGHRDVIDTCLKIFDEVVIAVMINPDKAPYLTAEERIYLLKKLYAGEDRVTIRTFSGVAADLLSEENTPFYVRGVRNTTDFEYENANRYASKKLKDDIITIYIPAEKENVEVSSSMVKSFLKFGKDFSPYVPAEIYEDLQNILKRK